RSLSHAPRASSRSAISREQRAKMAKRAELQDEIRRVVREKEHNEATLQQYLAERGASEEGKKTVQEMLLSGELIAQHNSKSIKRHLFISADIRKSEPPIVLRPLLDMSRRIYYALFTYRKEKAEVSRDELKALCKQVYTIERFTPSAFDSFFDFGLQRAIESGKIEVVGGERTTAKYRSGVRRKELLICALCNNESSDSHERKLECINCRWQRHASCMGLRKHKIIGDFECERCTKCAECEGE
ncbi:hypothetical protein PENTCL1PPCAC_19410, partial [Pristionchus entomophagus]